MNAEESAASDDGQQEVVYYTARHLLQALQQLDECLLDLPLVLVHGKELQKPNLVQGLLPTPTPVDRRTVAAKPPSLLTLGALVNLTPPGSDANGEKSVGE